MSNIIRVVVYIDTVFTTRAAKMSTISTFKLTGLVPATFTPMKDSGDVDYDKIEDYCKYLSEQGFTQIYVNGTTGEGFSLTLEEREKVVEKWIEVGKKSGRLQAIVVHVGALNVHDSIVLAKHAVKVGADAIGCVPPLFFKPNSIDYLVKYCQEVASAAPELPFYFYHLPSMTGVEPNIEDFLVAASKAMPSLVGVKFSSKDLVDFIGCVHVKAPNRADGRYNLVYGCDEKLIAGMVMGADGSVGSTCNLMPGLAKQMLAKLADLKILEARESQYRLQQACKVMYKYGAILGSNVAALKAMMELIDVPLGPARSPMRHPTPQEMANFKADLESIGFFDWRN